MCFLPAGVFGNPLAPLKGGWRKAAQDLGPVGSRPVGWQPVGVPLKRGRRKATQDLGLVGSRPVGWQPAGVPLKRGRRKATQGLGLVGSRPVGWQPAGVPLLRGSGVSETIFQTGCLVGQRPAGVFKMSSKCFQKLPWLVFKMSGRCL